jgi:membrane protein involved in colicin uptake
LKLVIETERKEAGDLIEGIKRDAEAEVATIREETERYAAQRRDSAAEQAAAILREAEVKAEAQAQAVIKNAESKASVERKKYALQSRTGSSRRLDLARAKCAELTGSPTTGGSSATGSWKPRSASPSTAPW